MFLILCKLYMLELIYEKDINLKIAQYVKDELEKNGVRVYMTRIKDVTTTLASRTTLANSVNADLFVSVHNNAMPNKTTLCSPNSPIVIPKLVVITAMQIIMEITFSKSGLPVVNPAITRTATMISNKPEIIGPV